MTQEARENGEQALKNALRDALHDAEPRFEVIARRVFSSEQASSQWVQYFKEKKYEEDVIKLAKKTAKGTIEKEKPSLMLDVRNVAKETSDNKCRSLVPELVEGSSKRMIRVILQEDVSCGRSFKTHLGELAKIKGEHQQELKQMTGLECEKFRGRMLEASQKCLEEVVSGKVKEPFFVAFLKTLKEKNAEQVQENLKEIHSLSQQTSEYLYSMNLRMIVQEEKARTFEVINERLEKELHFLKPVAIIGTFLAVGVTVFLGLKALTLK